MPLSPEKEKDAALADAKSEESRSKRTMRRHNLDRYDRWARGRGLDRAVKEQLRSMVKAFSERGIDISSSRKLSARFIADLHNDKTELDQAELYTSEEEVTDDDSSDDETMDDVSQAEQVSGPPAGAPSSTGDQQTPADAGASLPPPSAAATTSSATSSTLSTSGSMSPFPAQQAALAAADAAAISAAQAAAAQAQQAAQAAADAAAAQAAADTAAANAAAQLAFQAANAGVVFHPPPPHQHPPVAVTPRPIVPPSSPEHAAAFRLVKAEYDDLNVAEALLRKHLTDIRTGTADPKFATSVAATFERRYTVRYEAFCEAEKQLRVRFADEQWHDAAKAMHETYAARIATYQSIITPAAASPAPPAAGTAADNIGAAAAAMGQMAVQTSKAAYKITDTVHVFKGGYNEYVSFCNQWAIADAEMTRFGCTPLEKFWHLKKVVKGKASHCVDLADSTPDVLLKALGRLERKYRDDALAAKKLFSKMRIKQGTSVGDFMSIWEDCLNDSADLDAQMAAIGVSMYELTYIGRFESSMDDDVFEDWRIWIANQLSDADMETAKQLNVPFASLPEDKKVKRVSLLNRDTMLRYVQSRSTASREAVRSREAGDDDKDGDKKRGNDNRGSKRSASVSASFHANAERRSDKKSKNWRQRGKGAKKSKSSSRQRSPSRSRSPASPSPDRRSSSKRASSHTPKAASKQPAKSEEPAAASSSTMKGVTCSFCKKLHHHIQQCHSLNGMSTFDMRCWLQTSRRCFGCYAIVGTAHVCDVECGECGRKGHSTALHHGHDRITIPKDYKLPSTTSKYSKDNRGKKK